MKSLVIEALFIYRKYANYLQSRNFNPRRQHSAECGDLKLSREAYHAFAYVITSNVIYLS